MTFGEVLAGALALVGWGLSVALWRERSRWRALTGRALELNERVLLANQGLADDLTRAYTVLDQNGLADTYLAQRALESPQPSGGTVH